jgi:hypothetical protein
MSAPGDTWERRQQLDHRQPGNYEGQRGPAPRQESSLVGESEAGIRFGFRGSLAASASLAFPGASGSSGSSGSSGGSGGSGSLAFPGRSAVSGSPAAPMIMVAVTRLSLLSGVAHGNTETRDASPSSGHRATGLAAQVTRWLNDDRATATNQQDGIGEGR